MNHLLENLNPEQLAAVTLPPQHALILAGAGSGKTRVLTTRIAWLISTRQVTPQGILAVTFTNKAAKEMLARLSALLPINTRGMWIGTFHGLCNRLLRAHYRDAGLPQLFQILDIADQQAAIKRLLKALNVDDEKFPPRDLQHFINAQKEQGLRSAAVEAWDDHTRRRVELYAAYEQQCQREGVVDFAELLLRCYELLERNEPLRRHYQERFRHILVDEFQDTNILQYRWLKLLAGHAERGRAAGPSQGAAALSMEAASAAEPPSPPPLGRGMGGGCMECACMFAVGDDDQSIYGFRGAEIGNMRDFEREFQVDNIIRLEQNYRSHGNILDAANAIIKNNEKRLGKNLWTDAGSGEPIRVFEAMSDGEEARWIVEEVRALSRDGHARREIALLYRSNAQSRILEHSLFSAGIPYRVYGGLRFFERQEIKHALAYLRLIANSDDDTAFARVVNFPARGIGARSIEALQDAARAAGSSLFAAIPQVPGKAGASLAAFAALIESMRPALDLPLPELVDHVVELSGLRLHYLNEKEGQERLANLDELLNAATSFVAEEGREVMEPEEAESTGEPTGELSADLAAFLTHAALEAGEHQAGEGDDALQLMTVHSAKGLEFNVVFMSGLEEGLFPHENSVQEAKGLEEERRLMYVAVTRARQRLYLSFAQTRMLHGQTRYSLPSRFIDEIPGELLKWLTPKAKKGGYAYEVADAFTPSPRSRVSSGGGLRVGQNVAHARFGQGVIVNAEGSGSDARVQVNFGPAGMKWLALSVAKLEAL
ncbi:UvrD-helicase domain-containing protein [Denitratisoma oestradiolicum]|uniref:DNA 3'-5' helicase n=1 Tax=Denitratisoma oestradiolicum TaxID=311182 RepID=A0A6S6Y5I1_9PROT|nr:UvrD-helicase domain-containing protein [Denitratisoma oestradiolicum]TWO81796.1 DNA helicase II [Denitratisoma oestradiolicum]CAB1370757.1 DNA helicase II [Denitratisoma oestradiolicum]